MSLRGDVFVRRGTLRAQKHALAGREWCAVWRVYRGPDADGARGRAFVFPFEDIDDLIAILQRLKEQPLGAGGVDLAGLHE